MKKDNSASNGISAMMRALDSLDQADGPMSVHRNLPDGYMDLTIYSVLPGIYMVKNDIHASSVPALGESMPFEIYTVNYCIDGRCEYRLSDDNYSYVIKNLMTVSTGTIPGSFYYPSSSYLGYEIYIAPSLFSEKTKQILDTFQIALTDFPDYYPCNAPAGIADLWKSLDQQMKKENTGAVRLITLQLLYAIVNSSMPVMQHTIYLTKTQAQLAKQLKEILTENFSRHIAVRTVADTYGISETSLKNYFRYVYGMNVSTYLNKARMEYAGRLLSETTLSIADIARSCGYTNQGRFAKVFCDYYQVKPLDYRRASRHPDTL